MRLAVAQMALESEKKKNLKKMVNLINENAGGCGLMLFTEMSMGAKPAYGTLNDLAEDVENGEFASALRESAVKAGIDVCACLWEKNAGGLPYNTAMVYGSDGSIRAKYRKLHLFDALNVKESDDMQKGFDMPKVFMSGGINIGLGICYDLRFPEVFRKQVFDGAELFLVPSAWYAGEYKAEHLKNLVMTRALENTAYCACADVCGGRFTGNSAVYDPFGRNISHAGESEAVIYAEINMEVIKKTREILPCIENFRVDIF